MWTLLTCSRYVPVMSILSPVIAVHDPERIFALASCSVPAGFPSPAGDDMEDVVDPMTWVVRHPAATFWWKVTGHSLEDEGIFDGDLIAVDRMGKAREGRVVLVLVDGGVTVKKLERINGELWLVPKSKSGNYQNIRITETTELWGVVAGVVRRYAVE